MISFISEIDPFREGKAAERIDRYMKKILEEISQGSTKEQAIAKANSIYRLENGQGMVVDDQHLNVKMPIQKLMAVF